MGYYIELLRFKIADSSRFKNKKKDFKPALHLNQVRL